MENTTIPISFDTPDQLQQKIIKIFDGISDEQEKYYKIIDLGKLLIDFPEDEKSKENLVSGCQSIVYLFAYTKDDRLFFKASSDAIISSGLAWLAISAYSGLTAEEILKTQPFFVDKIGLLKSLTPGRSNGLASIIALIKKKALNFYLSTSKINKL